MRTIHYKHLEGLIKAADNTLTLQQWMEGTIYHFKSCQWVKFDLPIDEQRRAANLFASVWANGKTAARNADIIFYRSATPCGIMRRLWLKKTRKGGIKAEYCAGQDYVSELRYLSLLLKK